MTTLDRFAAVFVKASGIGIIGALASILASLLATSAPTAQEEPATPTPAERSAASTLAIGDELARTREELARARELMDRTQLELAALRGFLEAGGRPHQPDAGPGSG